MKPLSFIFIGRSGSGKGTQADLLMADIKKKDPSHKIIYISTGQEVRKFITEKGLAQKFYKEDYDKGLFAPEFLIIYLWGKRLVEEYTGNEYLVFDGMPRKLHEAVVLSSVFKFYRIPGPFMIDIDISREEAMKRLLARKRVDDVPDEINERLDLYDSEVVPVLNFCKTNPVFNYLTIDGERSIEAIHADIVKKVGLA